MLAGSGALKKIRFGLTSFPWSDCCPSLCHASSHGRAPSASDCATHTAGRPDAPSKRPDGTKESTRNESDCKIVACENFTHVKTTESVQNASDYNTTTCVLLTPPNFNLAVKLFGVKISLIEDYWNRTESIQLQHDYLHAFNSTQV
jgi:hypothetical protein